MKGKEGVYFAIVLLLLVSLSYPVSAGWFGDLFRSSGNVPQQPQNVSVTVVGVNPVSVGVPAVSTNPVELTSVSVSFYVSVSDQDGVNDVNTSSVMAEFTMSGQTTRSGSCPWQNTINTTSANFTCSVTMWYFDADGAWNMRVQAKDIGNGTLINGTNTFTYGVLKAMVISPSQISWSSVSSGGVNQSASNDPTTINNTGNYNGTVLVSGINLKGQTTPAEMIPASSFRVGSNSGSECIATALVNGTSTSVSGSNSSPGNLSLGGGVGQEQLYYCIPSVPAVSSQIYSTTSGGSWTIVY